MYKIGEFIIYGNDGVCKVEDIGVINISGANKQNIYYTLKSINESGKIFVPIDTKIFMRPIITCEEVQNLIALIPSMTKMEYNEKNQKLLKANYNKLFQTHECVDLLAMIVGDYQEKDNSINTEKKPGQIDKKSIKIAKDLINDEFSVVLGIPREEVDSYIIEKVKNIQENN